MLLAELKLFARFAGGLRRFVREPLTASQCRERLVRGLAERPGNFLRVMTKGVFARPASPYGRLLAHAGIKADDVSHLVASRGVEETLEVLFAQGVYVSLDEFKGRRPVRRGSLVFDVSSRDFDNPLSIKHFAGQSGGSRSGGTRTYVDFDSYAHDAAYQHFLLAALEVRGRPFALWCPPPPYAAGINELMRSAKLAQPVERWFAPHTPRHSADRWKYVLLTAYLLRSARLSGTRLPSLEHVPLYEAGSVAGWLADKRRQGAAAVLKTNVSSGVRICTAARERGIDISGTVFRLDSEPLTPAKARMFHEAGCRAVNTYAATEAGFVGVPCTRSDRPDEVHLTFDKLALIQRSLPLAGREPVPINLYTTLSPSTAKLLLNAELGDHAVVERRACGCPFDELGFPIHLHTIRSPEKLTCEGMNFIGADLHRLIEEVLPMRFGGQPTDYQLVEEEEQGLSRVNLLISPRLGAIDHPAAIETVLGFLDAVPNARDAYGERWRDGATLRVRRQEAYTTGAGKIPILHTAKPKSERLRT